MHDLPQTTISRDSITHLPQYDFSQYIAKTSAAGPGLSAQWVDSLHRYFNQGIETGAFLRAVLENDLHRAVRSLHMSEHTNGLELLKRLFDLLDEGAPSDGWGSADAVATWLASWDEGGSRWRP